jgi:hypothetical protein
MQTQRHRATQQARWWRSSSSRGPAQASVRSGPACAPACHNSLGAATRGEWFAAVGCAGGGNAQRRVARTGFRGSAAAARCCSASAAPRWSSAAALRLACSPAPCTSPLPLALGHAQNAAGAAWPLRAIVVIVPPRPVGPCLHGRLSSNVRPHSHNRFTSTCDHRSCTLPFRFCRCY